MSLEKAKGKCMKRKLILENGTEFIGEGFGSPDTKICEVVFNTSMAGYQEIISDPSYTYQAVVMTYPLIGNYGTNEEDYETKVPTISGLIVREYNDFPSNFRCSRTLGDVMKEYGIAGISGIDTRKLNRMIRNYGTMKGLITDADTSLEKGLEILAAENVKTDAVSRVSCSSIWESPAAGDLGEKTGKPGETTALASEKIFRVVAIDCGMKMNIVRSLNAYGCDVVIVPWNTSAEAIEELKPDGVFISNGPGDPTDVPETIGTIRKLIGKYPIFGICLGHQIISLAYGAKTYKLKFGHRGGNHPVKNLLTGHVEITSQNHSYAVDAESVKGTGLEITHINLLDQTVEGVRSVEDRVFSVQYHPESAPGPEDSKYLFGEFISLMKGGAVNA